MSDGCVSLWRQSELESLLAVQLRFSECSLDEDSVWPLFSTRADLALPEELASADGQWADVWQLVVALWGRLDFSLPAEGEAKDVDRIAAAVLVIFPFKSCYIFTFK